MISLCRLAIGIHHLVSPVQHLDLAVFGDSITESVKGTVMGSLHPNNIDHPAVWRHHFGDWTTEVFSIAGNPLPPPPSFSLPRSCFWLLRICTHSVICNRVGCCWQGMSFICNSHESHAWSLL